MMKFNEKYSREGFSEFLVNFLPEDYREIEKDITQLKSCQIIKSAQEIGYCKSLDVYVLEMSHSRNTDPRITIATDAFKILRNYDIQRALVIFKNSESDNYRFSYLTITFDINKKSIITKTYSNARRYSFYLGVDAKIGTPVQQLERKGRVKDTGDLLSRFSVEVVNKQFYFEVAKHFDELVSGEGKNLMLPGVSQENLNIRKSFAVRLIGRLMFCWFLKQKKSESGQLIPDGLLSSKIVSSNYYHSTLEPLFFGALNTSIDSRDIRSDLFDKVPYLNGGLFSPQSDDYYELDRGTFVSLYINTLKISDQWFKDFFELLETYNFTIDENTVFDQELSVDPEMLGRIFENLLAEINPETGSSERKRTGSFYTPRQIVEYMVDQSLLEYLKTKTKIDEKKLTALISYDLTDDLEYPLEGNEKQEIITAIESLKILDPACGSGAYPMGALQKIVYILQQIDPDCKLWLEGKLKGVPELYKQKIISEAKSNPFNYTRKLDIIQNSIFGVDIQPIAVDVSRLRCFLTLVVESEIDDSKTNRGIRPLPNLDFKFVCANTLIGLPKNESGQASAFDDHSGILELSKIMSEYFFCNSQRKNEIRLKFTNLQKEIFGKSITAFGKNTGELTLKLTTWNPFSNSSNSWFDPKWMFGLEEKFDVVIGNPPYVGEKGNKDIFRNIKGSPLGKRFYFGKMDLFYFFFHLGLDLLKDGGVMSYISTNYYITATGAVKLREDIKSRSSVLRLINFGELKIFESALGQHNMISILIKGKTNVVAQTLVTKRRGYLGLDVIQSILSRNDGETEYYSLNQDELYSDGNIKLSVGGLDDALNKMKEYGVDLGEITNVNVGLYTGADKVSKNYISKYKLDSKVGDGIFLLSKEELQQEKFNSEEIGICMPMFKNSDIERYVTKEDNDKFLIDFSYPNFTDYPINRYPNIINHLLKYKTVLENRQSNDNGLRSVVKQGFWWLFTKRKLDFNQEKIIAPQRSKTNTFGYNNVPWYASADVYFITSPKDGYSLKYLLGILNSHIIYVWLYHRGKRKGEMLELYQEPLSRIPIPKIDSDEKKKTAGEIELLVNQIITIKKYNSQDDTSDLEHQIDKLVMDLYGLNEEEKEIIRKS